MTSASRSHRPARPHRSNRTDRDDATSTILGAILVVALGFTFMVQVQTDYQPRWAEDREAAHLDGVISQFADLKAQSEKQSENRTLSPVSNPVRLSPPERTGLFAASSEPGTIEFRSSTINTSAWAPELRLVHRNGKNLGVLNEQWATSSGSSTVEDIERIESLRIRLTGPTAEKLELKKKAFVQLDITDDTGNFAGAFRAYVPEKDKDDLWVRIITSTGEVLVDQELAADVKYKEHNRFWIDALDPSWPFQQVLDAAKAPFSFELTYGFPELDGNKWPTVEYSATYVTRSTEGQEVFVGGGTGSTISNYLENHQGGRLTFKIPYQQLPEATLILENGALIIVQPEGASMILEPQFLVERVGAMTLVQFTQPVYKGSGDAVGGRSSASVVTQAVQVSDILGTGPRFTYNIDTEYPDVWNEFLTRTLADAGLTFPQQYSVTNTATGVQMRVEGSSAASTTHDVQINLKISTINIALA